MLGIMGINGPGHETEIRIILGVVQGDYLPTWVCTVHVKTKPIFAADNRDHDQAQHLS